MSIAVLKSVVLHCLLMLLLIVSNQAFEKPKISPQVPTMQASLMVVESEKIQQAPTAVETVKKIKTPPPESVKTVKSTAASADAQKRAEQRREREAEARKQKAKEQQQRQDKARKARERQEQARKEKARQAQAQKERERQAEAKRVHEIQQKQRKQYVLTELQKYQGMIKGTIQRYLRVDQAFIGKRCVLNIKLARSGFVTQAVIIDGHDALCRAAKNAVLKAETLPVSDEEDVYQQLKDINLTVEPEL